MNDIPMESAHTKRISLKNHRQTDESKNKNWEIFEKVYQKISIKEV